MGSHRSVLGEFPLTDQPATPKRSFSNHSLLFHVLTVFCVVAMLVLPRYYPEHYFKLMQEDRPIEWATVWLFGAAGIIQLQRAIRRRLFFDIMVAIFCLFVAFEEFSWGQRLLGYGSPQYFLANNYQQELNLHNLPGSLVKPKWILILALTGYGILLPLAARFARLRGLTTRVGATPPPAHLFPWFVAAVILLVWYPVRLTGEWVECLAGGLFVASMALGTGIHWILVSLALVFGVSMTKVTDVIEHSRGWDRSACARAEVQALVNDLTLGDKVSEKLKNHTNVHKRLWTAMNQGYFDRESAREFDGAKCGGSPVEETQDRRRYVVDPWGMSYWLSVKKVEEGLQRVEVYSFGPNRRRDGSPGATNGDDIAATGYYRQELEIKLPKETAP